MDNPLKVILQCYNDVGKDGSWQGKPKTYQRFVVLLTREEGLPVILREFNPYDQAHCCIGPPELGAARTFTQNVADIVGIPIEMETYTRKEIITVTWEKN